MDRDFSGLKMIGIAKWLLVVIAVVVIIMQSVSGRSSNTSITMMRDKVTEAADLTKMQEGDNQMIRRLYGLDVSQYEGIVLYYPVTNMGAEELLLVKMNDKSQQEEVRAAIEKRLETQKKSFAGYGVEQTAMLEKSVIDIREIMPSSDPRKIRRRCIRPLKKHIEGGENNDIQQYNFCVHFSSRIPAFVLYCTAQDQILCAGAPEPSVLRLGRYTISASASFLHGV
jgi:hypothetical protein